MTVEVKGFSSFSLPGDENKTNGGSVEALSQHPFDSSQVGIHISFFVFFIWLATVPHKIY